MSDVTTELAMEANDKAMEIARLRAENAKLREQVERLRTQLADMTESVGRVEERCAKTFEVGKRWMAKAARFEAGNAKLREQMERLVTLLRADCDIEASWDGLRKFWSIGLTENGCLMRDRACKAEAENAKLRELVRHMHTCMEHYEMDGTISCDRCPLDNCVGNCDYEQRMRELGVDE